MMRKINPHFVCLGFFLRMIQILPHQTPEVVRMPQVGKPVFLYVYQ